MTGEQIMAELKQRRLPTFGTAAERRDRLRKFHGTSKTAYPITTLSLSMLHGKVNDQPKYPFRVMKPLIPMADTIEAKWLQKPLMPSNRKFEANFGETTS